MLALVAGGSVHLQAANTAQDALNAVLLTEFAPAETVPGGTPKTITTITASADDLTRAVYEILANNDNSGNFSAADVAAAALQTGPTGTARKDLNTIAPRIVNAAIMSGDTTDTATITDILSAALKVNSTGSTKVQLTLAAKEAATATALVDDANADGAAAGNLIWLSAQQALNLNSTTIVPFLEGTLKTIKSAPSLTTFVSAGLTAGSGGAGTTAVSIAIADVKNPAAVNAAISGAVSLLSTATPDAIENYIAATAGLAKLSKVVSDVVAAGEPLVKAGTVTAAGYAGDVAGIVQNSKLDGSILSGALRVAGLTNSTDTTAAIVGAVFPTNSITTKNVVSIATAAGVGLGPFPTRAADLATVLSGNIAGTTAFKTQTAIGEAIIKQIGVANPNTAQDVSAAVGAVGVTSGSLNTGNAGTVAGTFAKAAPGAAAAGSAVAGIASLFSGSEQAISEGAIKADSKAALNIAQSVSNLLPAANQETYGVNLSASVATASAGNVLAGVAVNLGDEVESGESVYKVSNLISTALANEGGKLLPSAVKVATAVSAAVNEEQVANVATTVASLLGTSTKLKLSAASSLASALAKIDETKPAVSYTNRADELGELAASIVAGVLGKSSTGSTDAKNAAAEEKLLSSIGAAVIKAIGTKLYPNVVGVDKIPADLNDEVKDVAGSIAQTILFKVPSPNGGFDQSVQDTLLAQGGALEKALAKAAGTKYASMVGQAFTDIGTVVTALQTNPSGSRIFVGSKTEPIGVDGFVNTSIGPGTYEIGSVVDDETPAKNL
ncbi:MAG TPA: hypothetical protein VGH90_11640 [Chthoniobacteraceae bacterium]